MKKGKYLRKKRRSSRSPLKWVAVCLALLVACGGLFVWQVVCNNVVAAATVELGAQVSARDFLSLPLNLDAALRTDLTQLDLTQVGDYPVELEYLGKRYQSVLQVRDTTAPAGEVQNLSAYSTQDVQPEAFVVSVEDRSPVSIAFAQAPDMTRMGDQTLTILLTDASGNTAQLSAVLTILADQEAPTITGVTDRIWYVGQALDLLSGVMAVDSQDPAPVLTLDSSLLDTTQAGSYQITYIAADAAGNTATQTALVTVVDDQTAPQIYGARDISAYVGGSISYRSKVTVMDDMDPAPALKIDSSKVNLMAAGEYPVTYTATDAAGNVTAVTVQVTVQEKPESYVDPEVIYARVDAILAQFIREDMTAREKVEAVYVWTRRDVHLTYGSGDHNEDYVQLANQFLDLRRGDCYSFHAIQKLMLERLGIPTIDVRKVKNSPTDSNHVWLLVSVDGGETYYHFDNTWSKSLCLVTDAELNAFSASVESNPFNRDASLYPATPKEKLPASTPPWTNSAILNAAP